jgi:hypothetical protein
MFLIRPLFLVSYFSSISASRILLYVPTLCHSHVSYNGHLADVLIAAGHQVVR